MSEVTVAGQGQSSLRVEGSYRDPEGFVFFRDGRVFRAITPQLAGILERCRSQGLLQRLIERGWLVGTEVVASPVLRATLTREHPGWYHFLEHARLPLVTYPYEWCVSMLADAGLLTLDLQAELVEAGFSLKDASPFNVQFVGSRPTFIDAGSIEVPKRLDLWYALGQFQRMFLYPLLLARHRGWDLRSYFVANLNGRDPAFMVRALGHLGRWRPSVLLDVTLPWLLAKSSGNRSAATRSPEPQLSVDRTPQLWNLRRLRRKVARLANGYRPRGVWVDYTSNCTYDALAEQGKRDFVRTALEQARPCWVLDLGCNTGEYSLLAAEIGAHVIAVDQDHDAVEILYRRIRGRHVPIWPLVIDITNPTPALGLRNRERLSFAERIRADYAIALALIHHLLVGANLSLYQIEELLYELSGAGAIVEFVPPTDPMFRRLLRFRTDSFEHVTLAEFRRIFTTRFTIVREFPVPNSQRVLFWLRKPIAAVR